MASPRPNDVVVAATEQLTARIGRVAVTVDGDHEVYVSDPAVLTGVVGAPSYRQL